MTMPCPSQRNATMAVQLEHKCRWEVRPYDGGPYRNTFRTCSYCGSMHPEDLISFVREGRARLEGTTKNYKFYVRVPNPIAGQTCRIGSSSGRVFPVRATPKGVIARLLAEHDMPERLGRPTMLERIRNHYSRPTMGDAPDMVHAKFYTWHLSEDQRLELLALIRAPEEAE